MERVRIIEGEIPVLLIAPHGVDDKNTDFIAESVAKEFGAYAIINKGWKRSKTVDYWNDLANCNDVQHLHEDVVKEEFLDPILRTVAKMKKEYKEDIFMLIIHGCSNEVRNQANDQDLDFIVGFGEGRPSSYTCRIKIKDAFVYYLQKENFGVYEGKAKGKFAGRSRNNLNQLFTEWYPDDNVNSLQLEIVKELRCDFAEITINGIISALDSLMIFDDATEIKNKDTNKI
jgi:hypothetical protein